MKLVNYLIEETDESRIIGYLDKSCSQFIKEMQEGKNCLLRTRPSYISLYKELIKVKRIDNDRQPADTPKEVSEKIDNLLKSKFGWKPRSASLFTWIEKRSKKSERKTLQRTAIIIPEDGYKYIYSNKVFDLFLEYANFYKRKEYIEKSFKKDYTDFYYYFENILLSTYSNKNAMKTIPSTDNVECMIKAPKVALLSIKMISYLNEKYKLGIYEK